MRLQSDATKVVNRKRQTITIEGNDYYRLLQQDVGEMNIGRLVYNYEDTKAIIRGKFEDGFEITVFVDPQNDLIYADHYGRIPADAENIFGFIPPLGPLAEDEDILAKTSYIRANLNTSLAPRHLRNHLYQILTPDEFSLITKIINPSWEHIELLNYEVKALDNKIYCYYRERRIPREISWAGQGLQIWFQIITHLVRLRNCSILILDEPEINLHPEKQNELIRILRDYFGGSIIIATHSVELMNNVNISHIINVQKNQKRPKIKTTEDRTFLEVVRSQIGSNFNFIASQFEEVDIIIFTEDADDFFIIDRLAKGLGIKKKAFNIPIHGFNEYKKTISYRDAYNLLIGKQIDYSILLDRDFYPGEYLKEIRIKLDSYGIKAVYTIGKEIENIFLLPEFLFSLIPKEKQELFKKFMADLYESEYLDSMGNFISLHEKFLPSKLDAKTIIKSYKPKFDNAWNDENKRHLVIAGKKGLKSIRGFFKKEVGTNLTSHFLIEKLLYCQDRDLSAFINSVYQIKENSNEKPNH